MGQPRIADTIVPKLQTMTLEGVLRPAEKLPPEHRLTDRYGVFRTSLREAAQKLASQ